MINMRSTLILPLILSSLCGCATKMIAVADCPKPAPLSQRQLIPAPDPLLFRQCWEEAIAETPKDPTSATPSTPSCELLKRWTSSIENASDARVTGP